MGIGIKYHGGGGERSFSLDGVPQSGTEIDSILGMARTRRKPTAAMQMFHDRQKMSGDFGAVIDERIDSRIRDKVMPKIEEVKPDMERMMREQDAALKKAVDDAARMTRTAFGGSVVEGEGGLCLKGEELNPNIAGVRLFGSVNGAKGFHAISEIDPESSGRVLGPDPGYAEEDADTSERTKDESGAFTMNVCTRQVLADTDVAGERMKILYGYYRELHFTGEGRLFKVTGEKRQTLGMFMPGGGSGNGKYGIMAEFEDSGRGWLKVLLLGEEKYLSMYEDGTPEQKEEALMHLKTIFTDTCPHETMIIEREFS